MKKLRQYYSGKFGYYQPDWRLNNGLMPVVDGVTEFVKYDFGLTGAIEFLPETDVQYVCFARAEHFAAGVHSYSITCEYRISSVQYR